NYTPPLLAHLARRRHPLVAVEPAVHLELPRLLQRQRELLRVRRRELPVHPQRVDRQRVSLLTLAERRHRQRLAGLASDLLRLDIEIVQLYQLALGRGRSTPRYPRSCRRPLDLRALFAAAARSPGKYARSERHGTNRRQ